ncbi:MAG: homoserine dehydrogenase [Oscillospiraceae bacterium]|nr:homoserine dehydrogenase [Oscillospiraceae bacterium]
MANVAVLGHGIVGSGVVEVLLKNSGIIEKRCGQAINVKYILDIREFPELPYSGKFIKDFDKIINDPEIDVVAELIGGITPACDFVKASLCAKKSVVSSNKELIAKKGAELLKTAHENNVELFFDASVGGGIPIIQPLYQCLAGNEIEVIAGILNGTTNFILTKMIRESMGFDETLALAQKLGYAERDPSADVDGDDACRKICILANIVFGNHICPESVYTEGIRNVTPEDAAYAGEWGGVIKLIAYAAKSGDGSGVEMMVCPAFIKSSGHLAGIDDVFNGILVRGNAVGDVVFFGKGAGKFPTASAVIGDIISAVNSKGKSRLPVWSDNGVNTVKNRNEYKAAFYFRVTGSSADRFIPQGSQKLELPKKTAEETAFVTPVITEDEAETLVKNIEKSGSKLLNRIRVLEY